MPLPDFFVIGAAKSGTSAFFTCLKQHPGIFMSPVKEPKYFLFGGKAPEIQQGPRGVQSHRTAVWRPADYLQIFAAAKATQRKGEATPAYLRSPEAAHRIKENIPDAKLIVILRHPAERAYSHYLYMIQHCVETSRTFEEALAAEPERMKKNWFSALFYKTNGLYGKQLRVWYDLFPRDQIQIHLYEDWSAAPNAVLAESFRFLNVDPDFQPALRRSNVTRVPRSRRLHLWARHPERFEKIFGHVSAAYLQWLDQHYNLVPPPPLAPEVRQRLTAEYRQDILSLQKLIGRDLSHWL